MVDARQLLERQGAWQRERRLLSWPEKIRLVEAMRETAAAFAVLRERERERTTELRDRIERPRPPR